MLTIGAVVEFNGKTKTVVALRTGTPAIPWTVKCRVRGCRKVKRGYLTEGCGNGDFRTKGGDRLADLRDQDFVCSDHQEG